MLPVLYLLFFFFFLKEEAGIRDKLVTGFRRVLFRSKSRSSPADQRATYEPAGTAHAFDHLLDDIRVHPTHAQVVEEEERLGAAGQNVVDAVVHDIRPHRGMDSHGKGDFQLRAHAVGARDQHRFSPAVTVKRKQGAEPADAPKHVAGKGPPSQPADALLGLLGEGNTDASVGVSHCRKSLSAGLRGSWNPCWVFDPGGRRMTSNLAKLRSRRLAVWPKMS